jgi:hypothetical protein
MNIWATSIKKYFWNFEKKKTALTDLIKLYLAKYVLKEQLHIDEVCRRRGVPSSLWGDVNSGKKYERSKAGRSCEFHIFRFTETGGNEEGARVWRVEQDAGEASLAYSLAFWSYFASWRPSRRSLTVVFLFFFAIDAVTSKGQSWTCTTRQTVQHNPLPLGQQRGP